MTKRPRGRTAAVVPIRAVKQIPTQTFLARLARCRTELAPVLDRLSPRHGVEVLWATLLAEVADGALALKARGRLSPESFDHVIARLLAARDAQAASDRGA